MNLDQMCDDARARLKHSIHTRCGIAKKAIADSFEVAREDLRKRSEFRLDTSGEFGIGVGPSQWSRAIEYAANGDLVWYDQGRETMRIRAA